MSLTARHRWCAERISFCFTNNEDKENTTDKFDDSKVQAFIRKPKVLAKFNELFSGDGPAALFVHYQHRQHANELEVMQFFLLIRNMFTYATSHVLLPVLLYSQQKIGRRLPNTPRK